MPKIFNNRPLWEQSGILYHLLRDGAKPIFSSDEAKKIYTESKHKVKDSKLYKELFENFDFEKLEVQHHAALRLLKDESFQDLSDMQIMTTIFSRKKNGEALSQ